MRHAKYGLTLLEFREAFELHTQSAEAVNELAQWLLRHSRMFNYDNATYADAVVIAREVVQSRPNRKEQT